MVRETEPAATPPPRRRSGLHVQRFWLVIALVIVGATSLVVLAALMAPERQHDLWMEIAQSGLQILTLSLATGLVGAMLRDRDALREEQRRHQASLLAFLDDVEATYAQVKSARRMLRTFGFDSATVRTLNAEQAAGFRTQMALLNEAELAFETHARKVATMPRRWGDNAAPLVAQLTQIYTYLHTVLVEWQRDPTVLQAGEETGAMAGWQRFRAFVSYDDESTNAFADGVSGPMLRIGMLVGETELPPPAPLMDRFRRIA